MVSWRATSLDVISFRRRYRFSLVQLVSVRRPTATILLPPVTSMQLLFIVHFSGLDRAVGNESVSKIVINNTINSFVKTAISISLISNHNSFRTLFDKIVSVCYIWKIYLYFSIGNGQPWDPALCRLYRHTFVPNAVRCVSLRVPVCPYNNFWLNGF